MSQSQPRPIKTHRLSYIIVVVTLLIGMVGLGAFFFRQWNDQRKEADFQKSIQSFYDAPSPLPDLTPGKLIRSQKMDVAVPRGGTAYRILYVTQVPNNDSVAVSGMVFVPPGPAPEGGRKVIAWAHGTLGFGNSCTPSRSMNDTLRDMDNWLDAAMQRGYVVAATDYVGIGTAGTPFYLIGQSEANDVLNSVRAVRAMSEVKTSDEFVIWGHSQGGHAALFAALRAPTYTPELELKGVAAAAPAAELGPLFTQQYDKPVAWGIGPDVAVSWPAVYPDLKVDTVLSDDAKKNYDSMAHGCIVQEVAGLTIRSALKEQFFSSNPTKEPNWVKAMTAETPKIENLTVPLYLAQGLSDVVVLPNTTALLAQKACAAAKPTFLDWLGSTNHQSTAIVAGPSVMAWMQARFESQSPPSSCDQPLPIEPATM